MLEFIKEKSYYLLGGTILLLVIIIVVASCSSGKKISSYEQIEQKMINAAAKYYTNNPNLLPKEEDGTTKVNVSTLVEAELLDEIVDFKNKNSVCSGSVEVVKVGETYSYIPFLNCPNNYSPQYLAETIKNSPLDEYDNGIHLMDGEYIYRGDNVNNYVLFNNQVWRIIKVDKEGDIKLVYYPEKVSEKYSWDESYNSEVQKNWGITTDYFYTNIRKVLTQFYKNNFSDESKSKIASKNICIGAKYTSNDANLNEECSKTQKNEKIGLLQVSDYPKASLGKGCIRYDAPECTNRNYLTISGIDTWLLTTVADNTYEVYYLGGVIGKKQAYKTNKIYPVIYLKSNTLIKSGDGSTTNMYVIK